jgi:hypothetical protein
VTLTLTPDSAAVGEPIDIQVDAFDDVGVVATELTVDGVSIPLDPSGAATYSSTTAGVFAAVAIARDAAGNEGQAATTRASWPPRETRHHPRWRSHSRWTMRC